MNHPGNNDIHRAARDPWYRISYENDLRQHECRKEMARLKEQDLSRTRVGTDDGGDGGGTGNNTGLTVPQMLVSGAVLIGLAWIFAPILFRMLTGWLYEIGTGISAAITANMFDIASYGAVIVLVLVAMRAFVELRPRPMIIAGMLFAAAIGLLSYMFSQWGIPAKGTGLTSQILVWGFPIYSAVLACITLPVSKDIFDELSLSDFFPTLVRTIGGAAVLMWSGLVLYGAMSGNLGDLLWNFFGITWGVLLIAAALAALQFVNLLAIWMHQGV